MYDIIGDIHGHAEELAWFRTLPFAIELPGLRIVHACWDARAIDLIRVKLAEHGGVSQRFLVEALTNNSSLFRAVEHVCKGPELELSGLSYKDKDGHTRDHIRVRWCELPGDRTYAQYALPENPAAPATPVSNTITLPVPVYAARERPVFFGHYWLTGIPRTLTSNVACVDYSVANKGQLCAYQWNGEATLVDGSFVTVNCANP